VPWKCVLPMRWVLQMPRIWEQETTQPNQPKQIGCGSNSDIGPSNGCPSQSFAPKAHHHEVDCVLDVLKRHMRTSNPLLTPREAARLLGVSYPTIKGWILTGKLKTTTTPGGHHRIAASSLKPFIAQDAAKSAEHSRFRFRRVSGRNQLAGKVVSIRVEGLLAEVILDIGDSQVTAIITASAVRELQLKIGDAAAALIKSTDVMIERLD
jgi:molybdopterin-binding protein